MKEDQLIEMILELKENHENICRQLQIALADTVNIKFEGASGKQVNLPKKDLEGFRMGISVALDVIGNFPVKISKNEENK